MSSIFSRTMNPIEAKLPCIGFQGTTTTIQEKRKDTLAAETLIQAHKSEMIQ